MADVLKLFASLHEMELADVANHVAEKDYISSEQFEAYLVSITRLISCGDLYFIACHSHCCFTFKTVK